MRRQANIVSFDDARRVRSSRASESAQRAGVGEPRGGNPRSGSRSNPRAGAQADPRTRGGVKNNPLDRNGGRGAQNDPRTRNTVQSDPRTRGGNRSAHNSGTLFADEDFYNSLNFADDFGSAPRGRSHDGARRNDPRNASRNAERVTEVYEEETFDEDFDPDQVEVSQKGPLAKFKEKREKAKRSKAKEKAGKKFTSQYGGDSAPSDANAGPRAAVYKGEMGSQHKKATRLQGEGSSHGGSRGGSYGGGSGSPADDSKAGGFSFRRIAGSPAFIVLCAILACLLFCGVFLYGPAKQWYQEMRERDRLELEHAAIQERNEQLEASVEYLSTDEGVEDKAREEFGWVKEGEHAVSVSGIEVQKDSDFTANIVSSDIKPPDTWYSGFLDPFFGVNYDKEPVSEGEAEEKADEGSESSEKSAESQE